MANIVHFGKYYFPDSGGVESVTVSLARGAAAVGHFVSVICFAANLVESNESIDGVHVIRTPITILVASQPLGFKYFFQCLKYAVDADVVHLHAPNMLGAISALFLKRKTRLLVHWHSDVINKGVLGRVLRPLEAALLRRADSIVVTSQVYADASRVLASVRSKITVVPIGVSDAQRDVNRSVLPDSLSKKIHTRKIVLAVGRLVAYKGFDVLIEAAARLSPNSVVVIVGGGPLEQELRRAIALAGVGDRVVLAGRLSDLALHAIFERATIYCLPSIHRAEAFGVVLLEAMAYGLPIVATNIPGSGVPWVNQHGTSGLNVPVKDPEALANACNKILNSEKLRTQFAHGARERYLSEFTEEVSVKRVMDLYDCLISVNSNG